MARREPPQHWQELMSRRGISSVRQLATRAGLSHPPVNRIVFGESTNPSHETLAKVAGALGIPLSEIYELVGQPHPGAVEWTPPAESNLLTREQRRAIEDLIRSIVMTTSEESDGRGNAAPMNMTAGDPGGEDPSDELAARRERAADDGDSRPGPDGVPVPPLPERYAAYRIETEGMRQRAAIDEAGEESQAPPEDDDGA